MRFMDRNAMDWQTPDDYDLTDAEWKDLSMVGMNYQQEMDLNSGRFRHRKNDGHSAWAAGPAPQ